MSSEPTHVYVGPTTKWGLGKGTPVRVEGKGPNGMKAIRDARGGRWFVPSSQLEKKP